MKAEFESRADASQYKVTWSKNVHNSSATYESAVIKLGNILFCTVCRPTIESNVITN